MKLRINELRGPPRRAANDALKSAEIRVTAASASPGRRHVRRQFAARPTERLPRR